MRSSNDETIVIVHTTLIMIIRHCQLNEYYQKSICYRKGSLHEALERNDLGVEYYESEPYVANPPGLAYDQLPAHFKNPERKIEAKGKFLDTITKKLKAGQDENIVLQTSIHNITQSLVVYKLFS